MELTRKCIVCKECKPLTNEYFHKDKNRSHGLMYKCKVCESKRKDKRTWAVRYSKMSDAAKAKNKESNKIYGRTEKGKAVFFLKAYQSADKRKGLQTNITKEDIINCRQQLCVYCGFPASGFDRKDNKIGHIKENCVPACKDCNVARMDNFTYEEMLLIGDSIRLVRVKREHEQFGNCIL